MVQKKLNKTSLKLSKDIEAVNTQKNNLEDAMEVGDRVKLQKVIRDARCFVEKKQ